MSDHKLFAITGFGGGVTLGIQADSYPEFVDLAMQVYGDVKGKAFADGIFNHLAAFAPEAVAVGNVQQGFGAVASVPQQAPAVDPWSSPPRAVAQPVAQPSNVVPLNPPTVAYPGDCAHGMRSYVDKPARGKPWKRWECAIPWSKDVQGRCQPINVEG